MCRQIILSNNMTAATPHRWKVFQNYFKIILSLRCPVQGNFLPILVSRMVIPVIFPLHGHLNLKHESREVRSIDLLMLKVGLQHCDLFNVPAAGQTNERQIGPRRKNRCSWTSYRNTLVIIPLKEQRRLTTFGK